jgi:F420-0:gamma-glutamyl ligase
MNELDFVIILVKMRTGMCGLAICCYGILAFDCANEEVEWLL